MKKDIRNAVKQLLDDYLVTNNLRRTPERYAILDAVYSIRGHFSLEELDEYLVEHNFRVSRATLYNNLRLFRKLRFVICHRLQGGTVYERAMTIRIIAIRFARFVAKSRRLTPRQLSRL